VYSKLKSTATWLPYYLRRSLKFKSQQAPKHIYFCICDHYEPYWQNADKKTARKRLNRWLTEWPKLADRYRDSNGNTLKYSFFYPEEEYQKDDLDALAGLCHAGYGEVEIHLHHDNDTEENLRRTLIDFKKRLFNDHGLLSVDKRNDQIAYGFIHGNWALNNSLPDRSMCGVNNETEILLETGCYADFTLPSAPSEAQTRKINSLYYACPDCCEPKSHDWGVNASVGLAQNGLLMVQGPLGLSWSRRKWGIVPRIENGGLVSTTPCSKNRVREWISKHIHIEGAEDHVFVKIYAHGTQEENMRMFFNEKEGEVILSSVLECASEYGASAYFVSARQMVNAMNSIMMKKNRDFEYPLIKTVV
jgi:hypothetical protein